MKKLSFILMSFVLTLAACQHASEGNSTLVPMAESAKDASTSATAMDMASEAEMAEYDDESTSYDKKKSMNVPVERKIIRTADLRVQVKDVEARSSEITSLVAANGGYISGTNMTNNHYSINNHITIRVPVGKFDGLLSGITNDAVHVDYKRVHARDVTEEFVDVEARLKTKKMVRDRYVDVLQNKAKDVDEIILAEETIRRIQEEIEAKEGRLKYLKDQVGMSTISLEIYEQVEYKTNPYRRSFLDKIASGFANGWELCLSIILGLVNIWPLVLIGVALIWNRSWFLNKIRRKKP